MGDKRFLLGFTLLLLGGGLIFSAIAAVQQLRLRWLSRARRQFLRRREWLEAEFLTRASKSGRPRGLEWVDCDFDNDVTFARDRANGQLRALVGVTISFQAIAGGGMEHVDAVSNLRLATAVFHYAAGKWQTEGRAVFNLDPVETIRHFQHELERVETRVRTATG